MKRPGILSLAITVVVLSLARLSWAADSYTITDLGTLTGKANSWVWQQSVNDRGEVAVYANNIDDPNAFFTDAPSLWSNGALTPLPGLPGATSTIAYMLNNRGQAVGYSRQEGGFLHSILWDHGVLYQLPELPGDTRGNALMISDSGRIVGFTRNPSWPGRHAVTWYGGTVTRLPGLTGGDAFDEALGINGKGAIVGFSGAASGSEHAVLWEADRVKDLGTLGGPTSTAVAINDRGQIVGLADTAAGMTVPFLWKNGAMAALGIPSGDVYGLAQSINIRGQAVGFSITDFLDVTASHALSWKNGVMTDLQTTIPADAGWKLLRASGINNKGQISGFGVHNGQFRAFLLTPVP